MVTSHPACTQIIWGNCFVCHLSDGTVSIQHHQVNVKNWKDVKASSHGLMNALSYQGPEGTKKIHKKSIRIASVLTRFQTSYLLPKILRLLTLC